MATAAAAVAQLGRVEQEEELMKCLVQCVTGLGDNGDVEDVEGGGHGLDFFDEICGGRYIDNNANGGYFRSKRGS